jgi:hypothetical protein
MNGWRLQIKRQLGACELINLDSQSIVHIGDDTGNEICMTSTLIPPKLRMLQVKRRFIRLRLTDEVLSSFRGTPFCRQSWKTALYRGEMIDITEPAEWKIGDCEFKLFREEKIILSQYKNELDPQERKHAFQSVGMAGAAHVLLILVLLVGGIALRDFESPPVTPLLAKAEKISIAEVKNVFQPPKGITAPEERTVSMPPEVQKEVAPKKQTERTLSQNKTKAGPASMSIPSRSAATAAGSGPAKPNVQAMGLLAVAGARTSESRSLSIESPRVLHADPHAKNSGIGLNLLSRGVRAGIQTQQVAELNGTSVAAYESGEIARQITASRGPGVQLVRKEIEIRGGLDSMVVQQIVQERLAEVRYCYENALLSNTLLAGKVSTSWTILSNGDVSNLEAVSDNPNMQQIFGCIRDRINRWKFPEPKGGGVVKVKYPFVFSSLGS